MKKTGLLNVSQKNCIIEPSQSYTFDRFWPEDAIGISRCFYTVYGDSYSNDIVYNPDALMEANKTGKLFSIVARTKKGDVVGYCALWKSLASEFLWEQGQLVVHPSYRNEFLAKKLVSYGLEIAPQHLQLQEVVGKAVCNHTHSQKIGAACGFVETALEIDYISEEAYKKEKITAGPVSGLLMFRCHDDKPQDIFLPETYAEVLRFIYSGFTRERHFRKAPAEFSGHSKSMIKLHFFGSQRVARISVKKIGVDFSEVVMSCEAEAAKLNSSIVQFYLPLNNPQIAAAVKALRLKGYFLGGLVPRWFDQDGILMQKISSRPHFESILLYSKRAQKLLAYVFKDWEETAAAK